MSSQNLDLLKWIAITTILSNTLYYQPIFNEPETQKTIDNI
jgi:hypothetical protein